MINAIKAIGCAGLILLFGALLVGMMFEIAVGCGGHYIDSNGVAHVNSCLFFGSK